MPNFDLSEVPYHPVIEEIVDVLCNKTQNTDRNFFRIEVAYFLSKMASSMRAKIITKDRGEVPVNLYALALATSGFGKGHSVNIVEDYFMGPFKRRFMEETFAIKSDENLWRMAITRAALSGKDEDDEKAKLDKEFQAAGNLAFTFDSGTAPAVKQLRHKLLMANCGSINLQIDEIGSNLVGNTEVLNVFLELYDQGLVKQKLIKNTNENQRSQEIDGKTPTNALLFGTPSKLLDGGLTEDQFYSFLETGMARRLFFAWGIHSPASDSLTPTEIYERLTKDSNSTVINKWANHFALLADPAKFGWEMSVEDEVGITLLTYKIECEKIATTYPEHEDIRKAELSHRYYKVLKLAGALAFVDESSEITMEHLLSAIKLAEDSGDSFQHLLTREKPYVKLAKYIAASHEELTHADLHENLPFYKSGQTARTEMMTLATAWGYKQHIVIKKNFIDGIEFFTGETLAETDLDKMMVSYSNHFAFGYMSDTASFSNLHQLTQSQGMHWCNHSFEKEHRTEENVIPGFNMVVIDCDGDISLSATHDFMAEYKFMTYTTKRHTAEKNRFRLIMPIDYVLKLDKEDYKEFMNSFMDWLPFETDESANQRSKKWETFVGGTYYYNNGGSIMDVLRFVPKTSKNEQHRQSVVKLENLESLERWFAQSMVPGKNRNIQFIKYAFALIDMGMDYNQVEAKILDFNSKLSNKLSEDELRSTILQTVAKRIS